MSTTALQRGKTVSWSREWAWQEGEEETRQEKKAAFYNRKRKNSRTGRISGFRTDAEQHDWNVCKAKYMYSILISHEEGKGADVLLQICKTATKDGIQALAATNQFLSTFHREIDYKLGDDLEVSLKNFRSLTDTIGIDGKKRGVEGVWKDIILKEQTGTCVFVLNLLLECKLVLNAFPPVYTEVTEAGSSHDRQVAAIKACKGVRSEARPWVFQYGLLCDPRNPEAAIEGLIQRWDLLDAPVAHIQRHNSDGEGGSNAGSKVSSVAMDSPLRAKRKNSGDGQAEADGGESNTGKKQKN